MSRRRYDSGIWNASTNELTKPFVGCKKKMVTRTSRDTGYCHIGVVAGGTAYCKIIVTAAVAADAHEAHPCFRG